jgi:hypothetical protein
MLLFAMTTITYWIGVASFFACVGLIIHSVFPRRGPAQKPYVLQWYSVVLRAGLEFFSLWIWLSVALPLLAWQFWLGDNEHWFYRTAWLFAAAIAATTSYITVRRIFNKTATPTYSRIHLWVPLVLLMSYGGISVYEFAKPIKGWTAQGAAENVFAQFVASKFFDEPIHLAERTQNLPAYEADPSRCKYYWVMGVNEPRGYFSVCKHGWFWWRESSSARFPPSKKELDRAKDWITKGNRSGAILILKNIIENYPGTPAETGAKELLQSVGETVH